MLLTKDGNFLMSVSWQALERVIDVCPRVVPFMRADRMKLINAAARWPARKLPANS